MLDKNLMPRRHQSAVMAALMSPSAQPAWIFQFSFSQMGQVGLSLGLVTI